MNTIEIPSYFGSKFDDLFDQAIACECDYAYFKYNDVEVRVDKTSDLEVLKRDNYLAHLFDLKIIGPGPLPSYAEDEIQRAQLAQDEKYQIIISGEKWHNWLQ